MALPPRKSAQDIAADREKYRALDKHRAAMFVLTQKDRPIPSLQEMKKDLAKDELVSVKERIAMVKADHRNNLERLYAAHAEDYLDDQRLRRESRDGLAGEQPDNHSRISELSDNRDHFAATDHHYMFKLSNDITRECTRYSGTLISLEKRRRELERIEDDGRRLREAAFPLTLADFKAQPRDIQIRVATYLNADPGKKERMMSEFGWAWRQTDPLKKEYTINLEFRADVQRLLESRDPRKKLIQ